MIELLSTGQFLLGVLKDITALLRARKAGRLEAMALGALLELYGSATRLSHEAAQLQSSLTQSPKMLRSENRDIFYRFHDELRRFLDNLQRLNLCLIDIYYPGFRQVLIGVLNAEYITLNLSEAHLPQKFKPVVQKNKYLVSMIAEEYTGWMSLRSVKLFEEFYKNRQNTEQMSIFLQSLEQCRIYIGEIVRENWDFRELLGRKNPK